MTSLPGTMLAARFTVATRSLDLVEEPVPSIGPRDVLVKVEACGICLSDVHVIDGGLPIPLPSVIPGHEPAGTIAAVGDEVPVWKVGDEVILAAGKNCGRCEACAGGALEDCLNFAIMGSLYDGAWAQYIAVPFQTLCRAPEGVPLTQAAVLCDAVSTPFSALTDTAKLKVGESVALFGIGGLGVHAVQLARLLGAAPVIAVDPLPAARERALRVGADFAIDPADAPQKIKELTKGRGVDVALDLVGSNAVLAAAFNSLARRGRAVMVGLSLDPVQLGPGLVMGVMSQSLLGHLGYRKVHLEQLGHLVTTGRLDLSESVSQVMPLTDVKEGVRMLQEKVGNPVRLVVQPWA